MSTAAMIIDVSWSAQLKEVGSADVDESSEELLLESSDEVVVLSISCSTSTVV